MVVSCKLQTRLNRIGGVEKVKGIRKVRLSTSRQPAGRHASAVIEHPAICATIRRIFTCYLRSRTKGAISSVTSGMPQLPEQDKRQQIWNPVSLPPNSQSCVL